MSERHLLSPWKTLLQDLLESRFGIDLDGQIENG
jgi:hypothetical protein